MSHGEQQAGELLAALAFERARANRDVAAMMELFRYAALRLGRLPAVSQDS